MTKSNMPIKTEISNEHIKTMSLIALFIQDLGWDIESLEIRRYTSDEDSEEWKKEQRWNLYLCCAPKKKGEKERSKI